MHRWPFSAKVYLALFSLGVLFSLLQVDAVIDGLLFVASSKDTISFRVGVRELIKSFLLVVFIANIVHIGFIYMSYHSMEYNTSEWERSFPNWFGSRTERILRFGAFLVLLVTAGKFAPVEDFLEVYANRHFLSLNGLHKSVGTLVIGSAALFSAHVIWGLLACFHCRIAQGLYEAGAGASVAEFIRKSEPFVFLISDGIACMIWGLVLLVLAGRLEPLYGFVFILFFGLFYVVLISLRFLYRLRQIRHGSP